MGSLFFISVGYNACTNETGLSPRNGYEQVALPSEEKIIASVEVASPEILINDGASYTSQDEVNLTLSAGASMSEMFISRDKYCSGGVWESFKANRSWKLISKNKEVPVYVQFRDSIENDPTPCVKGRILHDDVAPKIIVSAAIQDGWVGFSELEVLFSSTDSGSGVKDMACASKRGGAYKACSSSEKFMDMKESEAYEFHVHSVDNAGNRSKDSDIFWNVDLTAPVVSFNQRPAALTADLTPSFSFVGLDSGSGVRAYDCILDTAATYTACPNEQTLSGLSDGAHTLTVRAIDKVGNISTPVEHSWVQETSAPTVEFVQTPDQLSNSKSSTFSFRGLDGGAVLTAFECRLDAGTWGSCVSPNKRDGLADGSHSFSVIGIDMAGNKSSVQTYSWIVDSTAPALRFVATPAELTKDSVANFQIIATDDVGGSGLERLECQRDSSPYTACSASYQWAGVDNGKRSLHVRAYDNAGNVSTPLNYTWTVDRVAPTIQISKAPSDPTNAILAHFEFSGVDTSSGVASYGCRLDGGAIETCVSPMKYASLDEGTHVFAVQAVDLAGNTSNFATYTWSVDRTGPLVSFVKQPSDTVTVGKVPSVLFRVSDASGIQSHNCSLNGSLQACSMDIESRVPAPIEGVYNLSVVAVDTVGNVTTETISWRATKETLDKVKELEVEGDRPIDILIVIDDSGSMRSERKIMSEQIAGLFAKLSGLDWQIALTSTDVRAKKGYDGNLIQLRGAANSYVLDSSMTSASVQSILGDTIENYRDKGGGDEMGIWATKRAIDRYSSGSSVHTDFFRDGADLSVILLSDEDENSTGTGIEMQPQDFVNLVNSTWNGQKNLTWHSIITKPGDKDCLGDQASGEHSVGVKYLELSTLTGYKPPESRMPAGSANGGDAVVGSVCETDYASQFATIGQSVRDMQKSSLLGCVPAKNSPVTVLYQNESAENYIDYLGPFQLQGQKIVFKDFLPTGKFKINYSCVAN